MLFRYLQCYNHWWMEQGERTGVERGGGTSTPAPLPIDRNAGQPWGGGGEGSFGLALVGGWGPTRFVPTTTGPARIGHAG
jgi:hypothetical protein